MFLAVGYAVAAIIGWAADVADGSDLAFWLAFLLGGACLILASLFLVRRSSAASVVLVSLGGLVGAVALVWSVIAPLLALVLIGLAVSASRRGRAVLGEGPANT